MIPPRIGFIGLGIMGQAMVTNLAKARYNLTLYNKTREKTIPFQEIGCDVTASPKDLAIRMNIIIIMVTDGKAVDDVMEGPTGIFAGNFTGNTLINMSTVSVSYTRQLAEKCLKEGIRFLDCPVAGSKPLAEAGKLIILAAGNKEQIEKIKPVLLTMGKEVIYAGDVPNGTALKLCMNLIVSHTTTGICESVILAETLKLNPELIFRVLETSPALNCGYFKMKQKNVLEKDFTPAFSLKNMLKDVRFMIEEAKQRNQNLPVTEAIEKLMAKSYNIGDGEMDLTTIMRTIVEYYKDASQPHK